MNIIDLIVCLLLLVAVWNGWRQGFIVQVCTLAGLIAAIWLAAHYGAAVGGWLGLEAETAQPGGFIAVLVVVVIAVAILARVARKLFHFAGFGIPDNVLGVAVSVMKYLLLMSVLFSAADKFRKSFTPGIARTVDTSLCYKPVMHISEKIFPFVRELGDRIPESLTPSQAENPEAEVQNE